jgi:hypothetical protein
VPGRPAVEVRLGVLERLEAAAVVAHAYAGVTVVGLDPHVHGDAGPCVAVADGVRDDLRQQQLEIAAELGRQPVLEMRAQLAARTHGCLEAARNREFDLHIHWISA